MLKKLLKIFVLISTKRKKGEDNLLWFSIPILLNQQVKIPHMPYNFINFELY